jgi:hypothetical protein
MQIRERLADKGKILIRIPISSSASFEKYKAHWYQLDAPRHLFLHSNHSIIYLLGISGFINIKIHYDSTIWQFVCSNLYLKGIPFTQHMKWYIKHLPCLVLSGKLVKYKSMAKELNKSCSGDQVVIVAEKKADIN